MLVAVASARIIATYHVFNFVTDEPAHIACGMEWLDRGTYQYEDEQPPLARIAAASLLRLTGVHSQGQPSMMAEGVTILRSGSGYDRNLSLARLGTLPFFWIACAAAFLWAEHALGRLTALWSLFFLTNLQPVLAHAGLATTDMALAALLTSTILMTVLWFERPTVGWSVLLGLSGGCAGLSKFSSLPFFVAAIATAAGWLVIAQPRRLRAVRGRHVVTLLFALALAAMVIWAGYRFSFGTVHGMRPLRPAPEFFGGLKTVRWHNRNGHLSYLLGNFSERGFRWYYPVALGVKSPAPFLMLFAAGAVVCMWRWREWRYTLPLASGLGMVAAALAFGHVNIGVRHVLPVYVAMSIVAGIGASWCASSARKSVVLVALLAWLVVGGIAAHPDYLSYFNELAGSHPERILIDSDLDWGQDAKRLERRLRELKAESVALLPMAWVPDYPRVTQFSLEQPSPGWNAAHVTALTLLRHRVEGTGPKRTFWVDRQAPTERIGRGILLWHIPE